MKFFNELLGFVVLTSPFWLILISLVMGIWIVLKVSKRFTSGGTKLAAGIGIFALIFLVLFGDEIAGRIYFNHLCATEAGVKVYKTVELPAEYWDEQGRAKFYNEKNANFNLEGYRVEYETGVYSLFFHIDNAGYKRVDKKSGQVLGRVTNFMHWGGWMRRNLSSNNTATTCEGGIERSSSIIKQIFKPKEN